MLLNLWRFACIDQRVWMEWVCGRSSYFSFLSSKVFLLHLMLQYSVLITIFIWKRILSRRHFLHNFSKVSVFVEKYFSSKRWHRMMPIWWQDRKPHALLPSMETLIQQHMHKSSLCQICKPVRRFLHPRQKQTSRFTAGTLCIGLVLHLPGV